MRNAEVSNQLKAETTHKRIYNCSLKSGKDHRSPSHQGVWGD